VVSLALPSRTVQPKACARCVPVRQRSCGWRPKGRPRRDGTPTLIPVTIVAAKTQVDGDGQQGIRLTLVIPLAGDGATVTMSDFFLRNHRRCFTSKPKRLLAARRLNSAGADGSPPMRQSARLTY